MGGLPQPQANHSTNLLQSHKKDHKLMTKPDGITGTPMLVFTMTKCIISSLIRIKRLCGMPVVLLLFCTLLLTGCDGPEQVSNPTLVEFADTVYLAVHLRQAGEDNPLTILFSTKSPKSNEWNKRLELRGQLIKMLPFENHLWMVYADGTVTELDTASMETKRIASAGGLQFEDAVVYGDHLYAISQENGLIIFILEDGQWKAHSQIPVIGTPQEAKLLVEYSLLKAYWRQSTGGFAESGLWQAVRKNKHWDVLPSQGKGYGQYAVTNWQKKATLTEEANQAPAAINLLQQDLQTQVWKETTRIDIPQEFAALQSSGLASLPQNESLLIVRTDPAGAHVFLHEGHSTKLVTTLLQNNAMGPLSLGIMLVGLLITLFLITMQARRDRRNARTATFNPAILRAGGVASPAVRAFAFLIDTILIAPLAGSFFWVSNDTWITSLTADDALLWYGLSMGGLCAYSTIAEGIWGQTAGKALLGIRVRNAAGGRLLPWQSFVRNIMRVIDFAPINLFGVTIPYLVALICLLLTGNRKRLGDIFGKTSVLLYTPFVKRDYLLASGSPRRRELLSALGLKFAQVAPDVDETILPEEKPAEAAMRLACKKATASVDSARQGEIIIAADTLIVLNDEFLGKPVGRDDARAMLRNLSGKVHRVFTGVCILDTATGQRIAAADVTEVIMRNLSDSEIESYVESGEADGKAGAYAIQETGEKLINQMHGSRSNVVGLPMEMLQSMLQELNG